MRANAFSRLGKVAGHLGVQNAGGSSGGDKVQYRVVQGVAVLTMSSPPVNSFSPAMQASLEAAVRRANADAGVRALIFTGAGKFFMAGADIPHLRKLTQLRGAEAKIAAGLRTGHALMKAIEYGSKPSVAAVNGPAFGGGLELAMSCNARVGTKGSAYGLPELKLGIIPGMGGTQRLPRLIGMAAAVKATLSGRPIPAKKAAKMGLVDQLVKKPKQLLPAAIKLALAIADGKVPRRYAIARKDRIGGVARGVEAIELARIKSKRKAKGTPHADAFLTAAKTGLLRGGDAGIEEEVRQFAPLIGSPSARALIHVFLSSRLSPKVPDLKGVRGPRIKTVGVLGGGTMGAGIVALLLFKGFNVILKEINQKTLYTGVQRVVGTINSVIKRMKLPSMALEMGMRNLTPTTTYDDFGKCDLVIEAIIENVKIKQAVFADLERYCRPDCVLATNTSTIDIDLIGAKTQAKDRIIGLHFFAPAHVMPLLEIIRTKTTSKAAVAASVALAKRIGKTPVTVGNCVGFTANRIFFPYGQSAAFLVDHGISPYRIDKALLGTMHMPMGVHQMGDLSGIDILNHVGKIFLDAYGDRCYVSPMAKDMTDAKLLGRKTGKGYYVYKGRSSVPNTKDLAPILARARQGKAPIGPLSDQDIVEMIMYPVVNESCRVIAEGHVIRASDVDVCSVTGYGFPSHKGGVMFWAKEQGFRRIRDRLNEFSRRYPAVRNFYAPCDYLNALASEEA